jgi:hypothetical protein
MCQGHQAASACCRRGQLLLRQPRHRGKTSGQAAEEPYRQQGSMCGTIELCIVKCQSPVQMHRQQTTVCKCIHMLLTGWILLDAQFAAFIRACMIVAVVTASLRSALVVVAAGLT